MTPLKAQINMKQCFLRHKNLNNILFTWVRTGSGTTNACMIYTNCGIKNVFINADFASNTQVSFFPWINYSFNVFHPSRPVLFNLRSTFATGKIYTKNFESPLPYKSKNVSVQFCLLLSHIASDFIRFISRPENVENSAKILSACCISCSSFKNNVKSSAYSAIFMILSKRPFLAFQ